MCVCESVCVCVCACGKGCVRVIQMGSTDLHQVILSHFTSIQQTVYVLEGTCSWFLFCLFGIL